VWEEELISTLKFHKKPRIKTVRPDGSEFWAVRELAGMLDYAKWDNFSKVID